MPQFFRIRHFGYVWVTSIILAVFCAAPWTAHPQRLLFQQLTVRDGLPSNFITCFTQDSDGRLWIGTADGVSIFDGVNCKTMTRHEGLSSNYVWNILQDRGEASGVLVATTLGLVRILGDSVVLLGFSEKAPPSMIMDMAALPDGTILAGGGGGLFRVEGTMLRAVPGLPASHSVNRLYCDPTGVLWILSDRGVHTFNPVTRAFRTIDTTSGAYLGANCIRGTRHGDVFVCTRDSSVLQFRNYRLWRKHRFPDFQPHDVLLDEQGTWWMATTRGLYSSREKEFSAERFEFHDILDNSSYFKLNLLFQDREKNIWFGSTGRGAGWLEDRSTSYFGATNMTGKGAHDKVGRIWLPCHDGIWECWRDTSGKWLRRFHGRESAWPGGYAYHIQATADDRLYVSFSSGSIVEFDIRKSTSFSLRLRLTRVIAPSRAVPKADCFCFLIDNKSRMWIKTTSGDIAVVSLSRPDALLRLFPVPHPDIRVIYEEPDGSIWIGGYDGFPVVNDAPDPVQGKFRKFEDLGSNSVRAFLRDRQDRFWIGTMNGAYVRENESWKLYDLRSGMPNERVFAIVQAKDDKVWLGTQTGVAARIPGSEEIFSYGELTDSPVGACGILDDGVLWISTAYGLTMYDQSHNVPDTLPPRPFLRTFYVNERPVAYHDGFSFAYFENNFRLEFSTPHLRRARQVRFEYRFVGIDSSWSRPTGDRSLTFPALPPGSYVIEIRARNSAGIQSPTPLIIRFTIRSPFWRSWWFLLGISVLLITVVVIVIRQRVRRLLFTERIRTRIAADLHDDIGTGLTRIAMLSDMMTQQTRMLRDSEKDLSAPLASISNTLQRTGVIARELVDSMSDVVWSLNPQNDTVSQLADRLRVFAYDITEARDIALSFDVSASVRQVRAGSEATRCLLLVIKEALNNAVRHAQPSTIELRLLASDRLLRFEVKDDGIGFDSEHVARRSGIQHMTDRITSSGGTFSLESGPGEGTTVSGSLQLYPKN
ncbi:MAG: two-component regulator propeller domain-containing protein [Bacteroidota bacterium]